MKEDHRPAKLGAPAITALLATAFVTVWISGTSFFVSLGLPSFDEILKWFFMGGSELSPSLVAETLAESPHILVLYLLGAAASLAMLVAAFRLLLPRGKEASEVGWNAATAVLFAGGLFFLLQLIGGIASHFLQETMLFAQGASQPDLLTKERANAVALLIGDSVIFVLLIFCVRNILGRSPLELRIHRKAAGRELLVGVLLLVLLFPAIKVAGHTGTFFINGAGIEAPRQITVQWFYRETNPWFEALCIFTVVIVAPLWEETYFRGFILQGLKRTMGGDAAIILTAVLFALAHTDSALVWLPILSFGLMLGYIFDRTGSLWVPVGFHAAFNAIHMTLMMLDKHHLI